MVTMAEASLRYRESGFCCALRLDESFDMFRNLVANVLKHLPAFSFTSLRSSRVFKAPMQHDRPARKYGTAFLRTVADRHDIVEALCQKLFYSLRSVPRDIGPQLAHHIHREGVEA